MLNVDISERVRLDKVGSKLRHLVFRRFAAPASAATASSAAAAASSNASSAPGLQENGMRLLDQ